MRVGELIKELEEIKNLDLDYIVCDSTGNEVTQVNVGLVHPAGGDEQDGISFVTLYGRVV